MPDSPRGKIYNRKRARQIVNYEGIQIDNITPTDIDGLIEYHDLAYILIELKYIGADVPFGQRLAIERLINDLSTTGKSCVAFIAEHNAGCENCECDDIIARYAVVRQIYYNHKWHNVISKKETLGDLVVRFIEGVNTSETQILQHTETTVENGEQDV